MKKRKVLLIIFVIISIVITSALLLIVVGRIMMCGNGVEYGIEDYSPADSSLSLCQYLTVRDSEVNKHPSDTSLFVNKYIWERAEYRYEYDYNFFSQKETVLLSLSYNSDCYRVAVEDISSQPGFSKEINFDYHDYAFFLNNTESLSSQKTKSNQLTDYCLTGDNQYLKWINLVGYSNLKCEVVFLGFYYAEFDIVGREIGHYTFDDWFAFFDSYYSFYDW